MSDDDEVPVRRMVRRKLCIIEFERIPGKLRDFILGHVRAGKEEFRKEIEDAGFVFKEEVKIPGFKEDYFLIFEKPANDFAGAPRGSLPSSAISISPMTGSIRWPTVRPREE
jgi:hypothetical protein